jgi:alkaline phosphatase
VLTLINQRSHTGWTSRGHTGDDVQVFAWGKGREDFIGNINNTDIPKIMLGRLPAATESGEKNK